MTPELQAASPKSDAKAELAAESRRTSPESPDSSKLGSSSAVSENAQDAGASPEGVRQTAPEGGAVIHSLRASRVPSAGAGSARRPDSAEPSSPPPSAPAQPAPPGGKASSAPTKAPTLPILPPLPASAVARDSAAIYVLGQVVSCKLPGPLAPYHTRGWHQPEADFTWIDGIEGEIEMLLRRPPAPCSLRLDVCPHGIPGRPQILEIFFNYFRLGRFEIPRPMRLSLELPTELFILKKTRIALHCPLAARPSDFGSQDRRRLGVAVVQWSMD